VLRSGWEQKQLVTGSRRGSLVKVVLLLLIIGLPSNGTAEADGPEPETYQVSDTVSAEEFDSAVQDTLQEKHFQWRLSREQVMGEEEGGAQGFVRDLMKSLVSIVKEGFGMAETLLERLFGGKQKKKDVGGLEGWGDLGKIASVLTVHKNNE